MASLDDIRASRLEKLQALQSAGQTAFPISANPDYTLAEVLEQYSKLGAKFSAESKKNLSLAGRVLSLRPQGAILFFTFDDGAGKFQGFIKKDEHISDADFDLWSTAVDIGDFVEVHGHLFTTARGEKTIQVHTWKMLAKSLRPLPEKWHGLQDTEERFRRRYLDTIATPAVKERFITRSKIVSELRNQLNKAGFLEVETPMLQPQAGGASALPFTTHHNALDTDLHLRIAPELYLKQLLVGGFPKVYEIGRNFRNEGIDVTHNPEFTMLEYYEAYSDAPRQMKFVEKMLRDLVKKVFASEKFQFDGIEIDLSKKFAVISYLDLISRMTLINNPASLSPADLKIQAERLGVRVETGESVEKILDNIYKKVCRPKLIQPTFIIDYPANYLPLAKRQPARPDLVDAFQLVIGGLEMVKAFSELNDPIDQRERFLYQEKNKSSGEHDAQSMDEAYVEAMEYGMPPAGGVGIGIDRLVMLLTNTKNIREVILFPTLRPR